MARGAPINWKQADEVLRREHSRFPRRPLSELIGELGVSYSAASARAMRLGIPWRAEQVLPDGYTQPISRQAATPPSQAARRLAQHDPAIRRAVELYDYLTGVTAQP